MRKRSVKCGSERGGDGWIRLGKVRRDYCEFCYLCDIQKLNLFLAFIIFVVQPQVSCGDLFQERNCKHFLVW